MMTDETVDLLQENAYIDTQEWVNALNRKVRDSDLDAAAENEGVDLRAGGVTFISTYHGNNTFVHKLKVDLARKGSLTDPQLRAGLNVLRDEIRTGAVTIADRKNRVSAPTLAATKGTDLAPGQQTYKVTSSDYRDHNYTVECDDCRRWFKSLIDVNKHRSSECGLYAPVILEGGTHLDISSIPDGNYAHFHPGSTGITEYLFLQIRTVKRTVRRDRKYRYGKLRSGKEVVYAGTIEVRVQRGDTKELVGEQRPGEGYRGKHADVLIEIMKTPSLWAQFYALQKDCCYICGKSLTDEVSRNDSIGPDCWKQWGRSYFEQWKRDKAIADFQAKHGADPVDEEDEPSS